jgi:hypothetical protein
MTVLCKSVDSYGLQIQNVCRFTCLASCTHDQRPQEYYIVSMKKYIYNILLIVQHRMDESKSQYFLLVIYCPAIQRKIIIRRMPMPWIEMVVVLLSRLQQVLLRPTTATNSKAASCRNKNKNYVPCGANQQSFKMRKGTPAGSHASGSHDPNVVVGVCLWVV